MCYLCMRICVCVQAVSVDENRQKAEHTALRGARVKSGGCGGFCPHSHNSGSQEVLDPVTWDDVESQVSEPDDTVILNAELWWATDGEAPNAPQLPDATS